MTGLQNRLRRFNSGRRLHSKINEVAVLPGLLVYPPGCESGESGESNVVLCSHNSSHSAAASQPLGLQAKLRSPSVIRRNLAAPFGDSPGPRSRHRGGHSPSWWNG